MKKFSLGIIGGGLSFAAVVVYLDRQCRNRGEQIDVVVFEPRNRLGLGVAYDTSEDALLLNVSASRMGIDVDEPGEFGEFVKHRGYSPDDFVPRKIYAEYISERLTGLSAVQIHHLQAEAQWVRPSSSGGYVIGTRSDQSVECDSLVIALGNSPSPTAARNSKLLSPYSSGLISQVVNAPEVAIVGSGLTAIDTILTLESSGFAGRYSVVSRRGLFPFPIESAVSEANVPLEFFQKQSLRSMVRSFRELVRNGHSVGTVIDALRGNLPSIWEALPPQQKLQFFRHVRPYWEISRHRCPTISLEVIQKLKDQSRLEVMRGRLCVESESCTITLRSGQNIDPAIPIVDCRGIWSDLRSLRVPVIEQLVQQGLAQYDPFGLGIITDRNGQLTGPAGEGTSQLFTLGALRRGMTWESTAVREIRDQAHLIVKELFEERIC